MVNFIRSLCIVITSALFMLIPRLFKIFYAFAVKPEILTTDVLQRITTNMYVLVSVVMLFALAAKSISAIVNPDLLNDNKKGVTGVIKRAIIALVLIVIIPFGFQYFYEFQTEVISKNLIEKFIMGINIEEGQTLESQYDVGQLLASTTLQAVLHPTNSGEDGRCAESGASLNVNTFSLVHPVRSLLPPSVDLSGLTVCNIYNKVIDDDIDWISYLTSSINATVGVTTNGNTNSNLGHYILDFEYFGLLAVIVGFAVDYMLVLFCIDSVVRLMTLAFLELTAPISVMAYIYSGNDMLNKWFKQLLSVAISFFLRVAAIAFLALVLSNLNRIIENMPNLPSELTSLAVVFLIIGTLIFVKKIPELIEKITGLKLDSQGGIGGRLGKMAGVGAIAQNAWKSLGNNAKGAVGAVAGLGLSAAKTGAQYGFNTLGNKFNNGETRRKIEEFKDSRIGKGLSSVGSSLKAGVQAGGGMKSIKATGDKWKDTPTYKAISAAQKQGNMQADASFWVKKNEKTTGKIDGAITKDNAESTLKNTLEDAQTDGTPKTASIGLSRKAANEEALRYANMGKTSRDNIINKLDSEKQLAVTAGNEDSANKIDVLLQKVKSGNNITLEDIWRDVNKLHDGKHIKEEGFGTLILNYENGKTAREGLKKSYNELLSANGYLDEKGNPIADITNVKDLIDDSNTGYHGAKFTQAVKQLEDMNKDNTDSRIKPIEEAASAREKELINYHTTQIEKATDQLFFKTKSDTFTSKSVQDGIKQNSFIVSDPTYGLSSSDYEDILSKGIKVGTNEFHIEASKYAGYNGLGNMTVTSDMTFGLSESTYNSMLRNGFVPYTPEFHAEASNYDGYNGLGDSSYRGKVVYKPDYNSGQQSQSTQQPNTSHIYTQAQDAPGGWGETASGIAVPPSVAQQVGVTSTTQQNVNNVTNTTTNNNQTNTTNTTSGTTTQQSQGPVQANVNLDGMQEAMRSAMGATNDILNRQLNEQQQQSKNLQDINQNTKSINENVSKLDDRTYQESRRESKAASEANDKKNNDE